MYIGHYTLYIHVHRQLDIIQYMYTGQYMYIKLHNKQIYYITILSNVDGLMIVM